MPKALKKKKKKKEKKERKKELRLASDQISRSGAVMRVFVGGGEAWPPRPQKGRRGRSGCNGDCCMLGCVHAVRAHITPHSRPFAAGECGMLGCVQCVRITPHPIAPTQKATSRCLWCVVGIHDILDPLVAVTVPAI